MKLNINAAINHTGYGLASLNLIKSLANRDTEISYFPIGNPQVSNQEDYEFVYDLLNKSQEFDPQSPCIKIWHQFDLASRIGNGKYIAYPFFELDTLDIRERKHLSVPNTIAVTSHWAKNILINNKINSDIQVVPLGVDRNIFDHAIPRKRNDDHYVFLTIGKWEIRKSHDILPQLFSRAFDNNPNVELWILASESTSSYSSTEEINNWKNLYSTNNIKVIPGVRTQNDIAQLISDSDCGLYISRAEGWNLELLETMSMNKPVIATNYSAHTEFCNNDNCYLVNIDETEKAYDGKAFKGQGNWAKIGQQQIDQTIEYMRYLYKNRINTNSSGIETAKKYSWQNSAEHLLRCI